MPAAPIAMPTRRGGERGRVVDAVADHRDRAALAFERLDGAQLVLGQQPGAELVDADRVGDGARRRARCRR